MTSPPSRSSSDNTAVRESLWTFRHKIAGMLRLRDYRDGFRVLFSRSFWKDFDAFWFDPNRSTSVTARLDEWIARLRENTGQMPDWEVERRRAQRRVHRDDT